MLAGHARALAAPTCARAESRCGPRWRAIRRRRCAAAALRLTAMLLEQQLLAPGVPHWQLADHAERARLEAVLRDHGLAIDDV